MARPARPGPIQAIVGEDTYLAEEALERILAAAVGEDRQDSVEVVYGDEKRWEDVVAAARTGSLFAPRRVFVVRRAELLRYAAKEEEGGEGEAPARRKAKTGGDPVEEYLDDPSPDATLVVLASRPDRRRRPWKELLARATVVDASPRKGRALRAYVEEELRRRGLRFAPEALEELLGELGQDLRRLMGEVDKLEAWALGRREITSDDVAAVMGRGLGQPLYLLSDAFAGRDKGGSLELVERLLADGEEGLRILATLHRSLRQTRVALALRESGMPRRDIASRLLPPNMQWKLDALLESAGRWTDAEIRQGLRVLGRTDRRMKRGADAATALVAAVAEACLVAGAAPTSPRRRR